MQMTPFVSVVMPVRNEASFISGSLGAVLAQDYPRDRMEIIVADGLSDDGTREIIRTAREKNPMVSLVDNPGKIVSTGLNAALRLAKGEIVVRVDGHCEIASDYVSRCVLHLTEDKVDCVGGPLETVGETYTAQAIAAAMSSRFGVGGSAFRVGATDARFADTVPFPGYRSEMIQRVGPTIACANWAGASCWRLIFGRAITAAPAFGSSGSNISSMATGRSGSCRSIPARCRRGNSCRRCL